MLKVSKRGSINSRPTVISSRARLVVFHPYGLNNVTHIFKDNKSALDNLKILIKWLLSVLTQKYRFAFLFFIHLSSYFRDSIGAA